MKIKIKNLTLQTIVGIYEFEQNEKQRVILNIEIDYDAKNSSKTDDVEDTLNYHPVCDEISSYVDNNKFKLLERLVTEVADIILRNELVKQVHVEIDKPDAAIDNLGSVSVSEIFSK